EQVRGCRRIRALPGCHARVGETQSRVGSEAAGAAVARPQLQPEAGRALQVVADDLVRLVALVEPVRVALVPLGWLALCGRRACDLTNEWMMESQAAAEATDESLLGERKQT